ncbi:MAG TPA: class I SAM-dependent methyltransferase [Candidatus Kapabacteria bacterium]|nr:class I SAM-dependent methyltransferase [Candidatus Kapabacteria bacterium]
MSAQIKNKLRENGISENIIYYWGYMYDLGKTYIVPYLRDLGIFKPGDKVAEIGSAEGGVLHSFLDEGSTEALGTDIAQSRLLDGERLAKIIGYNVQYVYHNIVEQEILPEWSEKYNLVILRDVIEHLDDPSIAIGNIKKIIKPGGYLFITFPPYPSAYGGHQHTLAGNFITKLPFIHLLPKSIFFKLINSGRPLDISEVRRLKDIQFTPDKMEKIAKANGYEIAKKEFYMIRPVYKMKFGLNPIKLPFGKNNKILRNYFSLEALYILKKV